MTDALHSPCPEQPRLKRTVRNSVQACLEEPRQKKREHYGIIPHLLIAMGYVILHTLLVLLQATTLNVAISASNKALLTIMMSNNFVELKGSVFKKFDKNNLFQVSCSDVRERFRLFVLMFVVVVQTMKEYGWREESFWSLAPDCLMVLGAEILVDWVKHAFITRFNGVSADVYKDYTISLAHDLALTKQKHAYSDHSDIVSRRMGFIPIPLGVVMLRIVYTAVKCRNPGTIAVVAMAYLCLLTFRVLGSIVILGKAADLIEEHITKDKKKDSTTETPNEKEEEVGDKNDSKMRNGSVVEDVKNGDDSTTHFNLPENTYTGHKKFLFQNSSVDRTDMLLPDYLPSRATSTPQPDSVIMVDSSCQVEVPKVVTTSATQITPQHQQNVPKLNKNNLVNSPSRKVLDDKGRECVKTVSQTTQPEVEINTRPSDTKSLGPSSQESLVTKPKLFDANLEIPPFGQTSVQKPTKINPLRDLEIPPFVKPANAPLAASVSPSFRKSSPVPLARKNEDEHFRKSSPVSLARNSEHEHRSPSHNPSFRKSSPDPLARKSEDEYLSTSPKSVHWASDEDRHTYESKEEFYVDPNTLKSPHNLMSIGDLYATADRFMEDSPVKKIKSNLDKSAQDSPIKNVSSNIDIKPLQDETSTKTVKCTSNNLDNCSNASTKNAVDNVSFLDNGGGVGLSPAGKAMSLSSPDLIQRLNKEDSDWPHVEESSDEEQLVVEDGELYMVSPGVRCRKKILGESSDGEGTQML